MIISRRSSAGVSWKVSRGTGRERPAAGIVAWEQALLKDIGIDEPVDSSFRRRAIRARLAYVCGLIPRLMGWGVSRRRSGERRRRGVLGRSLRTILSECPISTSDSSDAGSKARITYPF